MQRRKKRKLEYKNIMIVGIVLIAIVLIGIFLMRGKSASKNSNTNQQTQANSAQRINQTNQTNAKPADFPNVQTSDWDLILVNRDHVKSELNPQLTAIDNIQVDSRIADNVRQFLAAAQEIHPAEHLISGYRSYATQEQLYNSYIENEMVGGAGAVNSTGQAISKEQAIKNVQTYSQPPGSSEHMTGLAIDMSDVNSLNMSPPAIAEKVAQIAPQYGFVLRFTDWGAASTGVDHEDWHFRYVGVDNAKYMTEHKLTLEEYLNLVAKYNK